MNIHYDVTGLLTVVWRSHSGQIVWPAGVGREEGGSILIAHIRDIKESAGSRQLDRYARLCNRTPYPTRESSDSVQRSWVRLYMKNRL